MLRLVVPPITDQAGIHRHRKGLFLLHGGTWYFECLIAGRYTLIEVIVVPLTELIIDVLNFKLLFFYNVRHFSKIKLN